MDTIAASYTKIRFSWKELSSLKLTVLVLGLAIASPLTALIGYLVISSYALRGHSAALKALAMAWLIGALNSGIAFGGEGGALGRPLVYLAAAFSVFGRALGGSQPRLAQSSLWTAFLGLVIIMHSLMFSEMPDVSVLKAVIWTLVTTTIFQAFSRLTRVEMHEFTRWLFLLSILILAISWPLILSSVGFLRNGRGFQGILNHPQTYGVFSGLFAAFTAATILANKKPPRVYFYLLVSFVLALLVSQARTGGVAFLGGISLAIMALQVSKGSISSVPGIRSGRTGLFLLLTTATLALSLELWLPSLVQYLFKGYNVNHISQLYESSRGFLVERAMANFREHPFTGVGFGIDNFRGMTVSRDPLFGIPLSAPIEKGNIFFATLEELGLPVSAVVFLWLLALLPRSINGGLMPLTLFCGVLMVNVGEAIFFSPGGNGLLVLLLFGWAVHQAPQKKVQAYG